MTAHVAAADLALAKAAFLTSPSLIDKAAFLASKRAVVVLEGGGTPHPFTTPWDACDGGRPPYIQAMLDAGLPVFTVPARLDGGIGPTFRRTGCPPQPPPTTFWNSLASPEAAGGSALEFLGWLAATYGVTTVDLVGYSFGGVVARGTISALAGAVAAGAAGPPGAPGFSYAAYAVSKGLTVPSLTTLNSPQLRLLWLFFMRDGRMEKSSKHAP